LALYTTLRIIVSSQRDIVTDSPRLLI